MDTNFYLVSNTTHIQHASTESVRPTIWLDTYSHNPNRTPDLVRALEHTNNICDHILRCGQAHLFRNGILDPGAELVLHEDGYQALLCRPEPFIWDGVRVLRAKLEKIYYSSAFKLLPFPLQAAIVEYAMTFEDPVVEFSALYTNPRGLAFGRQQRRDRMNHLTITETCRDFWQFRGWYVQNNTFFLLDQLGMTFFLRRIGFHHIGHVQSIMMLSPTANTRTCTVQAMPPEVLALPLFTNLRSLTLVDTISLRRHPGVNACLEYLYKLAEFRPTLREIKVVDVLDVDCVRFLIKGGNKLREPCQLAVDRRALLIGLGRLNLDLRDPTAVKGNPYGHY